MVITKRLRLRKFKEDDLEELYDYRNNDRCNKYQRYNDTSKEYLNNFIKVNKSSEFLLYKENPLLCKGVQKSFSVQYVKKPPFVNTLK